MLSSALGASCSLKRPTFTIAYIGRYTNAKDTIPIERQEKNKFDLLHERVLTDYLAALGDSLDATFVLKTFDNHREARISDSLYRMIAADPKIALVIDNTWGEHLISSAPTIRANKIPVISMNADRDSADFGRASLFIGNDDDVPGQMIAYLSRGLAIASVNVLSERDYSLHRRYITGLADAGVHIDRLFEFDGKTTSKEGLDSIAASIIGVYRATPALLTEPLLLNVHSVAGDRIIAALDSALDGVSLIGGAYVASASMMNRFGRNAANEIVMMGRPSDAVTRKLALDLDAYRHNDSALFDSPSAPYFMRRCEIVVKTLGSIVGRAMQDTTQPQYNGRALMNSGVERLREGSIVDRNERIDFDSAGNLLEEVYFSKYQAGAFHSLPVQLNSSNEPIPNLFLGIDMVGIHGLDVNTNTFQADFFYWIKVDSAIADAEKYLLFTNLVESSSTRQLVLEKVDAGILYRLYKVAGVFQQQYQLTNYPLDEQELAIGLEILSPSDKLRISFDQKSLESDPAMLERFNVQAWKKQRYFVTVDNRVTESLRGDPELSAGKAAVFKTISFRLHVKRKLLGPMLQIVLPLSLIGFIAIALLYIKDVSFENLGEVSVGTFLVIITFSIALSQITPSSDYLTRADLLFWTTFLVVLVSFMTIIVVNSRYRLDELEGVSVHPVRLLLTALYPLAILAILYL